MIYNQIVTWTAFAILAMFFHVYYVSILQTQPFISCRRHTDFSSALKSFAIHTIELVHSHNVVLMGGSVFKHIVGFHRILSKRIP